MNGSELSKTSLCDLQAMLAQEEAGKDQKELERKELERWASAIAGCLQQAVPIRPATLGLGAPESSQELPAGWRPCVEALTPGGASTVGGPAATSLTSSGPAFGSNEQQSLQVRVKTEEFGEIALVVERVEAGLRVLLGAVDPRAVAALTRESLAVRQALELDGQNVRSLEIVRMNGLGTDLAQSKVAPSNRARRSQESAESAAPWGQRKKKSKRLDVIG